MNIWKVHETDALRNRLPFAARDKAFKFINSGPVHLEESRFELRIADAFGNCGAQQLLDRYSLGDSSTCLTKWARSYMPIKFTRRYEAPVFICMLTRAMRTLINYSAMFRSINSYIDKYHTCTWKCLSTRVREWLILWANICTKSWSFDSLWDFSSWSTGLGWRIIICTL